MPLQRTKSLARLFTFYFGIPASVILLGVVLTQVAFALDDALEASREMGAPAADAALTAQARPGGVDAGERGVSQDVAALDRKLQKRVGLALLGLVSGWAMIWFLVRRVTRKVEGDVAHLTAEMEIRELDTRAPEAAGREVWEEFKALREKLRLILSERVDAEARCTSAEAALSEAREQIDSLREALEREKAQAKRTQEKVENVCADYEAANVRLTLAIEEAQQSARNAEMANRAKSDFLAVMIHEIRTPLNGVIGFIDMLGETDLDEEQADYVSTVRSSSRTLIELINDILDFSKIESGNLNLELREFNLVRSLREVVALFYSDAVAKGLALVVDIGEEVPRRLEGDETRIRQIITNLLANAVKFTDSGEVRLLVCCDSLVDESGRCILEFEVRDTGIGMNETEQKRLFRPFSQGDSSTTRKYGGTGLGLAICKRLAEAMGGTISVRSEVERGTSFYTRVQVRALGEREKITPGAMLLRAAEASERASRSEGRRIGNEAVESKEIRNDPVSDTAPSGVGIENRPGKTGEKLPLRIVVAEDNIASQRVLMLMLRRLGWAAVFTKNGQELLDYLKDHSADLILMDIQMPGVDGFEATRKIRSGEVRESIKEVKIVALTANAFAGDEVRCRESGMDGYVSKPLRLEMLEEAIVELFNGKTIGAS